MILWQLGEKLRGKPFRKKSEFSLEEQCDLTMDHQAVARYCYLFSGESFVFVGFDEENNAAVADGANGGGEPSCCGALWWHLGAR